MTSRWALWGLKYYINPHQDRLKVYLNGHEAGYTMDIQQWAEIADVKKPGYQKTRPSPPISEVLLLFHLDNNLRLLRSHLETLETILPGTTTWMGISKMAPLSGHAVS